MNDRLRFRVWDDTLKIYRTEHAHHIAQNGELVFFSRQKDINHENYKIHLSDGLNTQKTVEQCTGQKDQNRRLIYENDIVDVYNPMTDKWIECQIVWEDDAAGWICRYLHPESVTRRCAFADPTGTYFEGSSCIVKGTIHDKERESHGKSSKN